MFSKIGFYCVTYTHACHTIRRGRDNVAGMCLLAQVSARDVLQFPEITNGDLHVLKNSSKCNYRNRKLIMLLSILKRNEISSIQVNLQTEPVRWTLISRCYLSVGKMSEASAQWSSPIQKYKITV